MAASLYDLPTIGAQTLRALARFRASSASAQSSHSFMVRLNAIRSAYCARPIMIRNNLTCFSPAASRSPVAKQKSWTTGTKKCQSANLVKSACAHHT